MQRFGKDMFFSFQKIRQRIKIPFKSSVFACSHFSSPAWKTQFLEILLLRFYSQPCVSVNMPLEKSNFCFLCRKLCSENL